MRITDFQDMKASQEILWRYQLHICIPMPSYVLHVRISYYMLGTLTRPSGETDPLKVNPYMADPKFLEKPY